MFALLLVAVAFASNNNLHLLELDSAYARWNVMFKSEAHLQTTNYLNHENMDNRFEIFAQHWAQVKLHNSRFNESYTLELNKFATMTNDEFKKYFGGYQHELKKPNPEVRPAYNGSEPGSQPLADSVDWRTQGLVTDVKNQGSCGSCWTFSAVVALEGQMAKATGSLVSLSEQDFVDCCKNVKLPGDSETCCDGCDGGLMDYAFEYLMQSQNGEEETELAYPYTGTDGTCAYKANKLYTDAKVTGYKDVTAGDEDSLKEAVANVGPISVAVDANSSWQLYNGGVLKPFFCPASRLDHGVAVVGYGSDGGKDYWIIKNSWGPSWGESGYVRLNRGSNTCGVANAASYPECTKN